MGAGLSASCAEYSKDSIRALSCDHLGSDVKGTLRGRIIDRAYSVHAPREPRKIGGVRHVKGAYQRGLGTAAPQGAAVAPEATV